MMRRSVSVAIVTGLLALAGCTSTPTTPEPTTPEPTASVSPSASHTVALEIVYAPEAVAIDSEGLVVFSDCEAQRVFRIALDGELEIAAGSGAQGLDGGDFAGDGGPATEARIDCPTGVVYDDAGNLFMADSVNNRVRMIDTDGVITTVAGSGFTGLDNGGYTGDGGPATLAELEFPVGIALDGLGRLYIADKGNDVIRRVDSDGVTSTIAGTGHGSFSGDGGPATEAELHSPWYLVFDPDGNLYFTDKDNARIRMIDTHGIISTIAGGGTLGAEAGNVPALKAAFAEPYGLAIDAQGRLFVSDDLDNMIRMIDGGAISTVAGTGEAGSSGEGGPAIQAQLDSPFDLFVTPNGDLYVADGGNSCVRVIDRQGTLTSVICG